MNIDQTFELPYGDEYPKPIFARYNLNRIEVKRTRKRAIERARRKTRSKMIEVGDMVEVIAGDNERPFAWEVGTVGYVVAYGDFDYLPNWASVSILENEKEESLYARYHNAENLKLIKKGSN